MNIVCSREGLRNALRTVSGVIDTRIVKEILKNVRLLAHDDVLEVSATDLDVAVRCFVRGVKVEREGGILVPAEKMIPIASESRAEELALQAEGAKLLISGKGSRFSVLGAPHEEFPEIPDFPDGRPLEIEGAVLREMVEKTVFAVAQERDRYALSGVLLVLKERSSALEMVATDGRRMALVRRKANVASPVAANAIVPVKALQQLQKIVSDEEVVKVAVEERRILVRGESAVLVAQLVEGRFPPYEEVIPADCDKKLEVATEEFVNAVRQAAVLAARDTRAVRLCAAPGRLTIESSDPEAGEAHVEMSAAYEGEPIDIRFNPEFLLDGAKAIDDESLRIEMKDPARAALMKGGPGYLYLLMPITQD